MISVLNQLSPAEVDRTNVYLAIFKQIKMKDHRFLLFFDYDGTLTPIVNDPKDALLSEEVKNRLAELAQTADVAIISGRDLEDLRERVGLKELYYAGSHGFDIAGPGNFRFQHEKGKDSLHALLTATDQLLQQLKGVRGLQMERKQFSLAVHYRQAEQSMHTEVIRTVYDVLQAFPELRALEGKKVIELQPDIDWDKGKAVAHLFDHLSGDRSRSSLLYIGDDLTDEHAFRQVKNLNGIPILVGQHGGPTEAVLNLENVEAVKRLLDKLSGKLRDYQNRTPFPVFNTSYRY